MYMSKKSANLYTLGALGVLIIIFLLVVILPLAEKNVPLSYNVVLYQRTPLYGGGIRTTDQEYGEILHYNEDIISRANRVL